jgi:citrate lyase subunit beta / citryl-CoA lyase
MRSLLFAPADSDRKLDKAFASGTDAVIIDLEDSVAPDSKPLARESAARFLAQTTGLTHRPRLLVRINSLPSGLADADLDAVVPAAPDAILLPKSEGSASVVHLAAKLAAREAVHGVADGHIGIIAIATETAGSLFQLGSYSGSSARLVGMTWGAEDLSAELGATANRDSTGQFLAPYRLARTLCLAGAVAAQVEPIDTVYVDFRDEAGLRRETEEACRDGFTGKMAIHPAQVAVINEVFTPTAQAVAEANAIVAAFAAAPGSGVVGINGVMYDMPHLKRAQRVLARANASSARIA